jgi:hypothetical protein
MLCPAGEDPVDVVPADEDSVDVVPVDNPADEAPVGEDEGAFASG